MKQTAVEWLVEQYEQKIGKGITKVMFDEIQQAKQMEKEQIMKTARQCHFEGVRQSAKNWEDNIENL